MSTLSEITYNIILPIFLIVGVTVIVDRVLEPDPRGLSRFVIYLFTPFLVLDRVANSDLGGDEVLKLVLVAWLMSLGVALVAWAVARLFRFDRLLMTAFILSAVLINAGNYGLPLNKFAFGTEGEERALVFFAGTLLVSYTLGVFLASSGTVSTRRALINVFKVPLIYAAALGLLLNVSDTKLDTPIQRAVTLLADAAIPGMLVVLGMQLSRASIRREQVRPVLMASAIRLIVAPLIALPLTILLGMSGLTRDVSLVQSAMPTAVIGGVLATEFGSDAEFVTATILVDTLLSIITLTILLSWLL